MSIERLTKPPKSRAEIKALEEARLADDTSLVMERYEPGPDALQLDYVNFMADAEYALWGSDGIWKIRRVHSDEPVDDGEGDE